MPLVINLADFRRSIEVKKQALSNRAIQERLEAVGNEYIKILRARIRQKVHPTLSTGTMEDGLVAYMGMWRTPEGGWAIGIGDMSLLGLPSDRAPAGTIRAFLEWYHAQADAGAPEVMAVEREVLAGRAAKRAEARAKREARQLERIRKPRVPKKPAWERVRVAEREAQRQLTEARKRDLAAAQRRREFLERYARERGVEIRKAPLLPERAAEIGRRAQATSISQQLRGLDRQIADLQQQRETRLREMTGPLRQTFAASYKRRLESLRERAASLRKTLTMLRRD